MKLCRQHIFLLGPPAVGKLTVAKFLSRQTRYPVFDNTKTVDIAVLLYSYGTQRFRDFRDELRLRFYEETVKTDIKGLISTYCYRHPQNWSYLTRIEQFLKKYNWSTVYFLLLADISTLMKRVQFPGRGRKMALQNTAELAEWIASSPQYKEVNNRSCTVIETSSLAAEEVAINIFKQLGVENVR